MSFTRPPRTVTTECSCKLWPSPGMYAVISIPLVRRTRATLRSAEFGLLGVMVFTKMQTPRLNGDQWLTGRFWMLLKLYDKAGDLVFADRLARGCFKSWLNVGMSATNYNRKKKINQGR